MPAAMRTIADENASVSERGASAARRKNGTHFRWCHAVRGLPVLVQRNGLARVLLKKAMKRSIRSLRSCFEVKLARRS